MFCTLLGKLVPAQVRAELEGDGLTTVVIRDYTGLEHEVKRPAISDPDNEPPLLEARSSEPDSDDGEGGAPIRDPSAVKPEPGTWSIKRPDEKRQTIAIMD